MKFSKGHSIRPYTGLSIRVGSPAKYYRLTAAGKRRLQSETDNWNRMAEVIAGILGAKPEEV